MFRGSCAVDEGHYMTGTLSSGEHFRMGYTLATARQLDESTRYALRLSYGVTDDSGSENVDELILISTLPGIPTGERWYFHCPRCGHRRKKLYMPMSQSRFGCRGCYDLTYKSVAENVSDAKLWAMLARLVAKDRLQSRFKR